MEGLIKLVLPFLSTPSNYAEILAKLASFAFYESYLITLLLRSNARVDMFLKGIESWGPLGKAVAVVPAHNVLNLSAFVIAFGVALLDHMFQLHDRISDVLGIRRRFDRKSILVPLAQRVGFVTTEDAKVKIALHRDELMHGVFYKYASSRADKPLVDRHDIEQALNAWCWFWVFVEATFYFGTAAIIAWLLSSSGLARTFIFISIGTLLIALVQRIRLGRYAKPQIDSIAADGTAAANVRREFDAL